MSVSVYALIAIGLGSTVGAWLRWVLGLWLNTSMSTFPLGTLSANLIGGLLIGYLAAFFIQHPGLSPEWRLFIITGFLGGLTTFSTFSLETVTLLLRGQYFWAVMIILSHVSGTLLMTILGLHAFKWFHQ